MSYDIAHLESLVDDARLHSDLYTSPEVFRIEIERIFRRAWILVGHECHIPNPGDYFTARVADEPLLVIRGKDGVIRAIVNRCTHRGAVICSNFTGNASKLTCPYHGWTFTLEGKLAGIPLEEDYPEDFDRGAHGLSTATIDAYRGFLFVCLEPNGLSLEAFLDEARTILDDVVDRSPTGEIELAAPPVRHRYKANWKMMFENLNDLIHPWFAHASGFNAGKKIYDQVGKDKAGRLLAQTAINMPRLEPLKKLTSVEIPHGHSYTGGVFPTTYAEPAQSQYRAAMEAHWGKAETDRILGVDRHVCLVYPSICVLGRKQSVRIITPHAVDDTEVAFYVYKLKGAPDEVLEEAFEYANQAGSAASPIVSDDLEIYERIQTADQARSHQWTSVHRCKGRHHESVPGDNVKPGTSEGYIMNQYRTWLDYMREGAR
jgi:phenylpropionate dioxygenase-like ring-hydroxylating dioxygenase large terminal subunit